MRQFSKAAHRKFYIRMKNTSWVHRGMLIVNANTETVKVLRVYRGDNIFKRILRHYDIPTRIHQVKVRHL